MLTIKPGFVDTPMTAEFKKGALWAQPADVARGILAAIDKGQGRGSPAGFLAADHACHPPYPGIRLQETVVVEMKKPPAGGFSNAGVVAITRAVRYRRTRRAASAFIEASQVRVCFLPADVREAEVQVAECAADGAVGQREMRTHAVGVVAQFLGHEFQGRDDLAALPFDPLLVAQLRGPLAFEEGRSCGIADTVSKGLPALDKDALAVLGQASACCSG